MGNGANSILGLETWYPNAKEKDCKCAKCGVTLLCELVACMGQQTYAFMKQAVGKETIKISKNVGVGFGPKGPTGSASSGGEVVIEKGEWLITYLRTLDSKHMCTDCFRKTFPKEFKGILLSSVGKAKVINSQYEWLKMSHGTT